MFNMLTKFKGRGCKRLKGNITFNNEQNPNRKVTISDPEMTKLLTNQKRKPAS